MRPIPALPFSSWPALTSRVFCRICSRRIRKWPGSLLTSSCRLQQFRHSPAGKGQRGQWSVWGWREVGTPGAIRGIPFARGSQKIHNQHSTLPRPVKHNDKFCIPGSSRHREERGSPSEADKPVRILHPVPLESTSSPAHPRPPPHTHTHCPALVSDSGYWNL